jgi:Meiotically up-regulated gene 113
MLTSFAFVFGLVAGAISVFAILESTRRRQHTLQIKQTEYDRTLNERLESLLRKQTEVDKYLREAVSFSELQNENLVLKHDLQNIDVNLRKLRLDTLQQEEKQVDLDVRVNDLGNRFLKDNISWIGKSLTPNNFSNAKKRMTRVIDSCRGIGLDIPESNEEQFFKDLKLEFEKVVRAAFEREEQARIRAQIRDEQRLENEIERELKRLETESKVIEKALERALAEAKDEHSAEVQELRKRLADAEERSMRAKSRAQLTKSGHVYVISNIGSFGENVYKIGMTRRLEPMDRVRELGDASVPFPFDVHMMISSDNAPALENSLHRSLHQQKVNKVNPRKEFFRTDMESIRRLVETNRGEVEYVADAEALQYRQSQEIDDADADYIEKVFEATAADRQIEPED